MGMFFLIAAGLLVVLVLSSIKFVRPTNRLLIERFGKYNRFGAPGLNFVIPVIEGAVWVNITEQMVEASKQEIITNDNLNASVDAQIYFKIKSDEESVIQSQYNVQNVHWQIVSLARTTLRSIIGTMTLKSANSERNKINTELQRVLKSETLNWGIEIVRAELKEIDPPADVQETMNKIVKAENEKLSAVDYATALETKADGERRAAIKAAEGVKQANILRAEGEAEAIRLVNEAANKYFTGNAQVLRKLEAIEKSLQQNAKIVVPAESNLVNVIGKLAGIE
ncbi:MAG TPA: SPFH domain-containing protein [Candidatus Omnitrophota bacterium]|nr:SPFH domain-containing protein [Candidatus Omnitrophota bacterium]HPS36738.1 SPFH domain-containing protein [Candidatus Omnitrophota bacterium]